MSIKKNNTTKKKILHKFAFVISLIIFLGSGFYLIQHLLIDPYINNKTMSEIKNIYYKEYFFWKIYLNLGEYFFENNLGGTKWAMHL